MKRAKIAKKQSRGQTSKSEAQRLPFIEHIHELRKRLFYVAVSIAIFSAAAYCVERSIIQWLLRPAGSQHFIYTSPIGGIDFLFRVCLYIGVAVSIPVIVYQFLQYIEPLLKQSSRRFIATGSIVSGILALAGLTFGYFIGLPAALHFLLHQFVFTKQIQPLITIQSYMSFVSMYMFGSALLFQIPLLLIFINRIKPLNPKKLASLKFQRWVIVGAFVGGGIMNPNPNLADQIVIVGPLILMYEIGVVLIWFSNRKRSKPGFVDELLAHDSELQSVRQQRFMAARENWQRAQATQPNPAPVAPAVQTAAPASTSPVKSVASAHTAAPAHPYAHTVAKPAIQAVPVARAVTRPAPAPRRRVYINDFTRPTRPYQNLAQKTAPETLDTPPSLA